MWQHRVDGSCGWMACSIFSSRARDAPSKPGRGVLRLRSFTTIYSVCARRKRRGLQVVLAYDAPHGSPQSQAAANAANKELFAFYPEWIGVAWDQDGMR